MKIKISTLAGIPLLILLAILVYFTIPWLLIFIGNQLAPNPPRPEITYGEFQFRLEYEINRKRVVIQDALICEYDGIGSNEGQGKYRKWKQKLASGNEEVIILKIDDTREIYFPVGWAEYYMDDLQEYEQYESIFPNAIYVETVNQNRNSRIISADELLIDYKIKLISWEPSQPIKNDFIPSNAE